jgi:hypothetical protein
MLIAQRQSALMSFFKAIVDRFRLLFLLVISQKGARRGSGLALVPAEGELWTSAFTGDDYSPLQKPGFILS